MRLTYRGGEIGHLIHCARNGTASSSEVLSAFYVPIRNDRDMDTSGRHVSLVVAKERTKLSHVLGIVSSEKVAGGTRVQLLGITEELICAKLKFIGRHVSLVVAKERTKLSHVLGIVSSEKIAGGTRVQLLGITGRHVSLVVAKEGTKLSHVLGIVSSEKVAGGTRVQLLG
ncbi:hypothetical protein CEXT_417631 [Caerostris extrusa]|uniref:Uncharacterized protein n=1 Tax=Caerostris extrusa TaxID=172846 RepID=A0AAV4MKD3_CAEEX|nr:hypothetical protein CEXT_417631 [Caerostris extrusa]